MIVGKGLAPNVCDVYESGRDVIQYKASDPALMMRICELFDVNIYGKNGYNL